MKKIGQKEILDAILKEALTIKRKRELFKEAQKINQELKQLNEGGLHPGHGEGHPGALLGWGFKGTDSPSPVMGLVTPSHYEEEKPEECGCKLDEFPKLEKDIEEFGGIEDEPSIDGEPMDDNIESLKAENEELKEKLAQIQNAFEGLNEGMFDKLKAGWQGLKAGVKTGVQAGQQQYQQTQQAQELQAKRQEVISLLSQAKAKALQQGKIDWQEIQRILSQVGYKYIGGATPSVVPLEEGEAMGMTEDLEEGLSGFLKGAAQKVGGDIKKGVGNVAGKVAGAVTGAAQNVASKVGQYTSDIKTAGQQASAAQDQARAEKADAEAEQQKQQEYIGSNYDKVINLLSQIK